MRWVIELLATFFGRLLVVILPAVGREIRKNNTVQQKGFDDATQKTLDDDIWNTANRDDAQQRLRERSYKNIRSKDRTPP